MKFALYGIDGFTAPLAREILTAEGHSLVWYCRLPNDNRQDIELPAATIATQPGADWMASLCASGAGAVVVAGGSDSGSVVAAVRQMANVAGMPVVLSHPLDLSALTYYEIELIAAESTARLIPLLPTRWSPAVRRLCQYVGGSGTQQSADRQIGRCQQVELERAMPQSERPDALRVLARDMDLIRRLTGNLTEVSAMGGKFEQEALPMTVQMSGPADILARWSAAPSDDEPGARLTVTGVDGKATLQMPADGPWRLQSPSGEEEFVQPSSLELLVERLDAPRTEAMRCPWPEVTHSVEVTEGVEKSLRRGRRIRLSLEGRGESSAFKGTMASLGCAMLVGGLFVLILTAIVLKIAKVSGLPMLAMIASKVPYFLAAAFVFFLLVQGLRYLIPRAGGDGRQQ